MLQLNPPNINNDEFTPRISKLFPRTLVWTTTNFLLCNKISQVYQIQERKSFTEQTGYKYGATFG